jgi:type II secretory pathway component PulC
VDATIDSFHTGQDPFSVDAGIRFKNRKTVTPRSSILLINTLLSIVILLVGAMIVMNWTSAKPKERSTETAGIRAEIAPPLDSHESRKLADYQPIVTRDIFGTTKQAARPQNTERRASPKEEIKNTALRLKLKGVALGENQPSLAIIRDEATKNEGPYYLNDFVQGARIVQILSDRVILEYEGRKEALIISDERTPPARAVRPKPQRPKKRIKRRPPRRSTRR